MAWLCRSIILLLGLLSQTEYVQACDDDCKDDLIQKFQNLLITQLDSKMEQILMKIERKYEKLLEARLEKVNDSFNELKTFAKESNGILTELMEGCKDPSKTKTRKIKDILESTEEMHQNGIKTDNVTESSLITPSNEVE
ncbi:unnamed protein product, partial [Meganyctiphanes norvegica]